MKKGFTLIELAMVLIVVGLLMGGGFQMMKVMGEKARSTEAKQTLEAAKEAVIGFVINSNGVLPTQADFTALGFRGTGDTNISYIATNVLQICNSSTTDLNTTDINNNITQNVAFVLAIAGENMNVQTGRNPVATDTNVQFHPRNINANVDDEIIALNRPEPYDDFSVQVTLGELHSLIDCESYKFKILNTSLPNAKYNVGYTPRIVTSTTFIPPYVRTGAIPSGVSFATSTGTFSGAPDANISTTYDFNITATNGVNSDTKRFVIMLSPN